MCVIIDANVAGLAFENPPRDDFEPLWKWIYKKDGRLVYGGKHKQELFKLNQVRGLMQSLWQAGRAWEVAPEDVQAEERAIKRMGRHKSDDVHVLALARASGARILCTNDGNLEADFKDRQLVPNPRGKIYKNAGHEKLLGHNRICRGKTSR